MLNFIVIIICILLILIIVLSVFRIKKIKIIESTLQRTENQIIGEIGEGRTAEEFKRFFKSISSEFRILRNVYIKFDDEINTEIDIIVISEYGIFVVENKNYRGVVSGSISGEHWSYSSPGSIKSNFPNPVKQNYIHIRAIKKYMDLKYYDMIYSYIVFNSDCELQKISTCSEFVKIIKDNEIYKTLWHDVQEKIIRPEEIEKIYQNLYRFSNVASTENIYM
jgi:hypothetical protein